MSLVFTLTLRPLANSQHLRFNTLSMVKSLALQVVSFLFLGTIAQNKSHAKNWAQSPELYVQLVSDKSVISSQEEHYLSLYFKLKKDWHIYWRNPGDSGTEPQIKWSAHGQGSPNNSLALPIEFRDIQWPLPKAIPVKNLTNYGYENEVYLSVPFNIQASFLPSKEINFVAEVDWLVCKIECIPGSAKLNLKIPTGAYSQSSSFSEGILKTLNSVPVPAPNTFVSTFTKKENFFELQLSSTDSSLEAYQEAYFYPFQGLQISHSKKQTLKKHEKSLFLELAPDDNVDPSLSALTGVIVLRDKEGRSLAYEISASQTSSTQFAQGWSHILWLCALAFLGGLILNLMPCVLPVLSLKVLALVKDQALPDAAKKKQAWAYTAGVLVSFITLALTLIIFKTIGEDLGWGFQLQNVAFVFYMIILFYLMALCLMGYFDLGSQMMGVGQNLTQGKGLKASFFTGVLAVLVATPCTAPFMGVAIGSALTLGALANIAIFLFLGLGMAIPYLAVAYFPKLISFIPKPGLWMERFKEFLAFPLLATALWLLTVLADLQGYTVVILSLVILLLLTFAIWMQRISTTRFTKIIAGSVFIFALIAPINWLRFTDSGQKSSRIPPSDSTIWKNFNPEKVNEDIAQGKIVFIDYTATWCVTCQVNKKLVLETDEILTAFTEADISLYRADWTKMDSVITKSLAELGRRSVPTYVFHTPSASGTKQSHLLPELLTKSLVLEEISKHKQQLLNSLKK